MMSWHEEPIAKHHDRKTFDCGNAHLNDFLQHHARRSHDIGGSKTFLAIDDTDGRTILGFYSLAPTSIEPEEVPSTIRKGLARHQVPGFRLTRLAVSLGLQGQGLGGQLLLAAGRRCLCAAAEVGGVVLAVDAKDDRAADWYRTFGAISLADKPLALLLPLATIAAALRAGGHDL